MAQIKDRMQRAPDYATYKQEAASHPLSESAAEKDLALVVQNFHYRYEMIQDYLDTFMKRSGRVA